MTERKPFSPTLYKQDDSAKWSLIDYLTHKGFDNPRVNPDDYGIDVLAERDDEPYAFEVEVKHNWKGESFPFPSVHYVGRKTKFINNLVAPLANTYFVTINDERTVALRVDGKTFSESPLVAKKTIYTTSEHFVEVAIAKARFFYL